jgi:V/A-type H+/Na+-transporting ATPase subunit I
VNLTSRKMKRVQMTVLRSDVNTVIEYLGRHKVMHFVVSDSAYVNISSAADNTKGVKGPKGDNTESSGPDNTKSANIARISGNAELLRINGLMEKLRSSCEFLGVELPAEPAPDSVLPGEADEAVCEKLCSAINALKVKEIAVRQGKQGIEEAYGEAKAFSSLNAPFADLDQLSFLTLRVGRLDPKVQVDLKETLGERAVIIPLGGEGSDRLLAASSRKGRFALDSELKKTAFKPISIPEGYQGVPAELLEGLEGRLKIAEKELEEIENEKTKMRDESQAALYRFGSILLMAIAAEEIKSRLVSTSSVYLLSGWIPADMITQTAADLSKITHGRTAIRIYVPDEVPEVKNGSEKVPVSMKHGKFVKGFEGVIFSYGAPLYGTIDPTPIVAIFFTLLFGIMFGDSGQGAVLLLLGLLTGKYSRLAKFKNYSTPLISVGIASIVMGFITGEIFTREDLFVAPTRVITRAITGHPIDRLLTVMPLAEHGGSVIKLFYFFGFTIGMGIVLNSLGLLINIYNKCALKKYEEAFFGKAGLSGLLLFWYAIFIALRCIFFKGRFEYFDMAGILVPCICIFFGPVIWRCIARERPLLSHGLMTFIMEGFVEVMETASGYISNTVSFLRVGAFALSHGVLSYIVFRFTEELAGGGPIGSVSAMVVFIFGNLVIIVLEGMIVAIQVVRLQYYEFFSKFFTETGVEFAPFRFRKSE